MKKFSLIITACAALMAVAGCNCKDLSYWEVGKVNPKLHGRVVTNGSKPLAGAEVTVTVGNAKHSTTTDADGLYSFNEIEAGEATVSASYSSDTKIKEGTRTVKLKENTVSICNFLLVKSSTDYKKVKVGNDDMYSILLPDIVAEDKSTTQIATYYVEEGTLEKGDELLLEAWYELDENAATKADGDWEYTENDVVICVTSTARSGVKVSKKPIKVTAEQLIRPQRVLHNSKTVTDVTIDEKSAYFYTTELGETDLYYPILKKDTGNGVGKLTASPEIFNGAASQIEFALTEKFGTEYVFGGTFLDQYVVLIEGGVLTEVSVKVTDAVNIPAGEALVVSGTQAYSKVTYKCEYAQTSVIRWGGVSLMYTDRQHTGGSN